MKHIRLCQLPVAMSITARSSSITNAFFNTIIPVIQPSPEDELEALRILEIDPEDVCCAYCGGTSTEWDHLRAIIHKQEPTGYITEIAILVPSCGKCNQSKGNTPWREWMEGDAKLSPKTRKIGDLAIRIERLDKYEHWRVPHKINFAEVVDRLKWQQHKENWSRVLSLLKESQKLANELRVAVGKALTSQSTAA
jgi:hypothetical protein